VLFVIDLPVPNKCPMCRHKEQFSRQLPRRLYDRMCVQCEVLLKSPYSPERSDVVYCEECYFRCLSSSLKV
jgi:hypothetical protein